MNSRRSRIETDKRTFIDSLSENDQAEIEAKKLRLAVETSGDIIFSTNLQGIINFINPAFTRLYGYTAEEVIGKTTPRILKSGKLSAQYIEDFWNKLIRKEIVRGNFVNRCKDGRLLTVESSISPFLDEQGDLIGFLAVQREIPESKLLEEEIKQRNKELAALNAVAAIVSQSLDLDQILHIALDEVLRMKILGDKMYGMLFLLDEQRQILTLKAQQGAPENHPCLNLPIQVGECLCGRAVQCSKVVISDNSLEDERHIRHWPGMLPHKDICIPIMARGKPLGVMEIRLPGTYEYVKTDIDLLVSVADHIGVAIENAQLRELRERVVIEERQRIARELHDGLSQLLGYINTKAMAVRLLLQKNQINAADKHLSQLEEAAKDLLIDVRESIWSLKLASQDKESLVDNLGEFCNRFIRLNGLPVKLTVASEVEDLPLGNETKYQLLRIIQEALNNVRKHASASQVQVNVQFDNSNLLLSIQDDGVGFDPQTLKDDGHLGLNTMRERAFSIGADFQILAVPAKGVCVRVKVPVRAGMSQ